MKRRVVVLGATGMLGSMVTDVIARDPALCVTATVRVPEDRRRVTQAIPGVRIELIDVAVVSDSRLTEFLADVDWVVNAVGVIKPHIADSDGRGVKRAIEVNALFPHRLASAAESVGCRVLQIATDCVFSGRRGGLTEEEPHDAEDVYGKTKSLGEVCSSRVSHLRCSIIGPEWNNHRSLMSWFLTRPTGAVVDGFTNHQWNGITTLHFGQIVRGIIRRDLAISHLQHLVPADATSKYELLEVLARVFRRNDLTVVPVSAPRAIDRALASNNNHLNTTLWEAAGYERPPTIEQMVETLSTFNFRMGIA